MAKRLLSNKQPEFTRSYELQWTCPECGIDNTEEKPNETARNGDAFQCYNCDAVFIVKRPAKPRTRKDRR